jgi:hypothetical protein
LRRSRWANQAATPQREDREDDEHRARDAARCGDRSGRGREVAGGEDEEGSDERVDEDRRLAPDPGHRDGECRLPSPDAQPAQKAERDRHAERRAAGKHERERRRSLGEAERADEGQLRQNRHPRQRRGQHVEQRRAHEGDYPGSGDLPEPVRDAPVARDAREDEDEDADGERDAERAPEESPAVASHGGKHTRRRC